MTSIVADEAAVERQKRKENGTALELGDRGLGGNVVGLVLIGEEPRA